MSPCLLQIDFAYAGPWGDEMAAQMEGLARSIAETPGLHWKIWTENQAEQRAGGIYLFADHASATAYLDMHRARLASFGVSDIRAQLFAVGDALSRIDRAPLP